MEVALRSNRLCLTTIHSKEILEYYRIKNPFRLESEGIFVYTRAVIPAKAGIR
jgi:hypothetical protein